MKKQILGIDIGGVIIARIGGDGDTSFQNKYLDTPPVSGALELIGEIVKYRFQNDVHLISKCGLEVESLTRNWLSAHRFFEIAMVSEQNLHFCRERYQKAQICTSLGVTHFIDDRLEVLGYLKDVKNLYLFQPRQEEVFQNFQHLDRVHLVNSWIEVRDQLLMTV